MELAFASPVNAVFLPGPPGIPGPPGLAGAQGAAAMSAPTIFPPKLRKTFPETWIWDNVNKDG